MFVKSSKSALFWHNWNSHFVTDDFVVSVNWATVAAVGAALFKLISDVMAKDNAAVGADIMAIIYALGFKSVQVTKTPQA